jgi:cell division septal protein FtsQ
VFIGRRRRKEEEKKKILKLNKTIQASMTSKPQGAGVFLSLCVLTVLLSLFYVVVFFFLFRPSVNSASSIRNKSV